MSETEWTTEKPQQAGLYGMRKIGAKHGTVVEVVPPNKYRLSAEGELRDLPNDGYEYSPAALRKLRGKKRTL